MVVLLVEADPRTRGGTLAPARRHNVEALSTSQEGFSSGGKRHADGREGEGTRTDDRPGPVFWEGTISANG
jgi:hypothetical protein